MTNILIDTNIWHYAIIKPKEMEYQEVHYKAKDFLKSKLENENININISNYQVAEILEVLRRGNLKTEERDELLADFLSEGFVIVELKNKDVIEAYQKSKISNIHIYDYLVAYPLKGKIKKIYSADDHFQHKDFKDIAPVENPLHPWILKEGRKPEKTGIKKPSQKKL